MSDTTAADTNSAMEEDKDSPASAFNEVKEGAAAILFPKDGAVFYNPVQEFNRDLSIAAISQFNNIYLGEQKASYEKKMQRYQKGLDKAAEDEQAETSAPTTKKVKTNDDGYERKTPQLKSSVKILEALSATGLRSIRYYKELENIDHVIANDLLPEAVENIRRNVEHCGLDPKTQVIPNIGDATTVMSQCKGPKRYDIIDLDPYGTAAPFLDSCVQAAEEGGLLCITCTDMAVLAGNHPETCHAKYGCFPVKGKYCHEMGIRIVLGCISQHASRHKRYIVPMMSCSIDFYCRVFVRIYTSAQEMKKAACKLSYVSQCTGCETFTLTPLARMEEHGKSVKFKPALGLGVDKKCEHCHRVQMLGGPIWNKELHDKTFVEGMLADVTANPDKYKTNVRMVGHLNVVKEELPNAPLYYTLGGLTGSLHCTCPKMEDIRSALLHEGYEVSLSHCNPGSVKTTAPSSVVMDIMRGWVKLHPVTRNNERSPAFTILSKEPSFEANFETHPDANPPSRQKGISRFPNNPLPNWGPKARAKKRKDGDVHNELGLLKPPNPVRAKKDRKHIPCKKFRQGECEREEQDCMYSHDPNLEFPKTRTAKKRKARTGVVEAP